MHSERLVSTRFPTGDDKTNDKHPLSSLKRGDQVVHLTKMLNSAPLDKLKEIVSMIKKELER